MPLVRNLPISHYLYSLVGEATVQIGSGSVYFTKEIATPLKIPQSISVN